MRLSEVRSKAGDTQDTQRQVRGGYCKESCSACCEFLVLQVNPAYKSKDVRRWIELHGIKLVEKDGGLFAHIPSPCSKLKDGMCSIYEDRPDVCRSWPSSQAEIDNLKDFSGEDCTFHFKEVGNG